MNRLVVAGLVGFVVGSVASYLYCKKRFDEGCCEMDREEYVMEEEGPISVEQAASVGSADRRDMLDIVYEDQSQVRTYNKIVSKLYGETKDEPRVITEMEFTDECEEYDKATVLYYDDGVVTDDREEIMDDVDGILGKNLTLFGYGSDDKDVLYVRNDRLKIDYEVLKQNATYRFEE